MKKLIAGYLALSLLNGAIAHPGGKEVNIHNIHPNVFTHCILNFLNIKEIASIARTDKTINGYVKDNFKSNKIKYILSKLETALRLRQHEERQYLVYNDQSIKDKGFPGRTLLEGVQNELYDLLHLMDDTKIATTLLEHKDYVTVLIKSLLWAPKSIYGSSIHSEKTDEIIKNKLESIISAIKIVSEGNQNIKIINAIKDARV